MIEDEDLEAKAVEAKASKWTMDEDIKRAVITVDEARGFILETPDNRLVVTAAHCLPRLPVSASISSTEERTYPELIGPPNGDRPKVWAECLFVDPVADIAVLGSPDDQSLYEESKAYDELTRNLPPLRISDAAEHASAWLLTLDNRWVRCEATHIDGSLWIENAAVPIIGGMSGSPILNAYGMVIGVLCCSAGTEGKPDTQSGPNPCLSASLPARLLKQLGT